MIVSIDNTGDFNLPSKIVEPGMNTEASSYIVNNYKKLIGIIKSYDICEDKAEDLLSDVYISIRESEADGNGYDMTYSMKNGHDNIMMVEQFVIGRIKLYAKNDRYRSDVIETGITSYVKTSCYEVPKLDTNGYVYDKDGNQVMEKKYIKEKINIKASLNAASFNSGNDVADNNDSFQKAYAMAECADAPGSIEDVNEYYSLHEQIDYCIDICSMYDVNILNILRNMDKLASLLGDVSRKKKTSDIIFKKLHDIVEYHDEFGTALMNVIRYSMMNRSNFDAVLASFE